MAAVAEQLAYYVWFRIWSRYSHQKAKSTIYKPNVVDKY